MCTMGRCGSTGCIPFPGTSTDAFGYFGCTIPMTPSTLPCPDISSTGTIVSTSDDGSLSIPLGFSFDFYGTAQSSVTVWTNGAAVFDTSYLSFSNSCFPYTRPVLAPYWDDLYPPGGGSVRYQRMGAAPNRQLVVNWNVPHISFSSGARYDVTMVLNETSNDIEYCYRNVVVGSTSYDNGRSATIGINAARPTTSSSPATRPR